MTNKLMEHDYNGEAVACNAKEQTRREIEDILNELKP